MSCQITGFGNALVDALVILENDAVLDDLSLNKGTMHLVDDTAWNSVFEKVNGKEVVFDSGGSCANTIATLGLLGAKTMYCGQVGDDELGILYAKRIQEACGQHAVQVVSGLATGKCLSMISADAERTMVTDLGAAVQLNSLGDFPKHLKTTKIAHFTGYTLLDGPMCPLSKEAMALAQSGGAKISLDVADPFVVSTIRELMWTVLTDYIDIVFLNEDEARSLTDQAPEEAIQTIAKRANVETVVIKMGKKGALIRHHDQLFSTTIRPVNAIDTTGAGDAFAGGFLYGLTQGWTADRCGWLGSQVAGLTVSQVGAVYKDRALLQSLIQEA